MVRRTYPARAERSALCDRLVDVGPDQPTLCEGWTTRDLAAHLLVRERRPVAATGIVIPALASRTESARAAIARDHPFEQLILLVRHPPRYSPAALPLTDKAINTVEFFIHHEDVRRGVAGWQPRELSPALSQALRRHVAFIGRLALRRFPAKVTIEIPGLGKALHAGDGEGPPLTLSGAEGELALFLSGRQRAAQVDVDGPADLADRLRSARLGL